MNISRQSRQRNGSVIPWQRIGKDVSACQNSAEALEYAGLDFTVEKRPIFTYNNENFGQYPTDGIMIPEIEIPKFHAVVRTDSDQPLGVVTDKYKCWQNSDIFSFFDNIIGANASFDYAGFVDGGRHVYLTAKLPKEIRIGRDDKIDQFLFASTSHDGSKCISLAYTPVRPFCTNMLNPTNAIHLMHTANLPQRLEQAKRILNITRTLTQETEERYNHWAKIRISDPELKQLIQLAMAPNKETLESLKTDERDEISARFLNTCDQVYTYAKTSQSQLMDTTLGTVFGAYNAVTGYFQNVHNYRNDESKLKSMLYGGSGQRHMRNAFNLCEKYAAGGHKALMLN
ncbi:DUF932 domain-containing protein [Chitinophaga barathri]|uniref:DUF945 domain-containing protein n=1 Tax=Chitinophaga barathri TaxID=1647451 RepID=A0A3N4M7T6_9BACT|nr:DUF932 domain-containing protein [Chitinophaga barathri]RPD39315.1 DUF945 domain-containing protein [Chitinophaga barathri]